MRGMDRSLEKLTVLFADISGSTALYEKHGDEITRADMAACLDLLRGVAEGLGGETLKTIGDEIMIAFENPVKAALCAAEMQAGLRKANGEKAFKLNGKDEVLHIKIGWHAGAVNWRDDELLGEAPVTAQQIINRAKADEILTSKQSAEELPDGMFKVHILDRVDAEAWDGKLDIVKVPWEQTGEETKIVPVPISALNKDKATLIIEYEGKEFKIDADQTKCTIGRGRHADFRVNGNFTSRQHAEISFRNGRFNIKDESRHINTLFKQNRNPGVAVNYSVRSRSYMITILTISIYTTTQIQIRLIVSRTINLETVSTVSYKLILTFLIEKS